MRPKNYWPFGGFEPGGAADEVTDGPTDKVVAGIEVGVPLPVGVVILFYPFESICEKLFWTFTKTTTLLFTPLHRYFLFLTFLFCRKIAVLS